MIDIMDKTGLNIIDDIEVPTCTHIAKIVNIGGNMIPCIIDDILEHRDTYIRNAENEIDFVIKPSIIRSHSKQKIVIFLDFKPSNKVYRYMIDTPVDVIEYMNKYKVLLVLDTDNVLLHGVMLSDNVLKDVNMMKKFYELGNMLKSGLK